MAILEKKFNSILSKLHLVKINYFLFNSLKFLCDCRSILLQLLLISKINQNNIRTTYAIYYSQG